MLCSLFTRQQGRTKTETVYTALTPQEVELEWQEKDSKTETETENLRSHQIDLVLTNYAYWLLFSLSDAYFINFNTSSILLNQWTVINFISILI